MLTYYVVATTTKRKSAEERREAVLDAAYVEFAEHGLHGGSTEAIAAKAGISQPYVFRLFGTKKELFIAVVARCFRETLETFQRSRGRKARAARLLDAMGKAYIEQLLKDGRDCAAQMQAYAACDDPEIRERRAGRIRRPRRLRRARRGRSPAGGSQPLLRQRHAPERDRLDGAARTPSEPWAARLLKGITR